MATSSDPWGYGESIKNLKIDPKSTKTAESTDTTEKRGRKRPTSDKDTTQFWESRNKENKVEKKKAREYTHFISIPVCHSESFTKALEKWKNDICAKFYNKTIIDQIFINPKITHFTILMLPLENHEQILNVQNVLKNIEP